MQADQTQEGLRKRIQGSRMILSMCCLLRSVPDISNGVRLEPEWISAGCLRRDLRRASMMTGIVEHISTRYDKIDSKGDFRERVYMTDILPIPPTSAVSSMTARCRWKSS